MSKLKHPIKHFKGEYPGAVARAVGAPRPHLAAPGRGSVLGGAARPPPARQPPAAGAAAARHRGQVSGDWSRVRVLGSHWSSCPRVRVLGCDWPVSRVWRDYRTGSAESDKVEHARRLREEIVINFENCDI